MNVWIKQFDVEMEVKNSGIELAVDDPATKDHLGDLYVTKTKLIWCKGKTARKNGKEISWKDFTAYMESL